VSAQDGVWDLISDGANEDKERTDHFIEQARERAERKQARIDALTGNAPRPYDRERDDQRTA
jgi:hypothetical protein